MKSEKNNIIIGIDTSCYTTSIAAISLDRALIYNEKIMLEVKENSKGLRQSEAVFQHINNLGKISDKINKLMENYTICAICASSAPRPVEGSYMPVFKVGHNFSKMLGSMISVPVYETTHQENHIEASLYTNNIKNKDRFLSVHMSGGTTEILLINKDNKSKNCLGYDVGIVGGSKDISFGQLIDRVGVSMGYPFPAGKYLDQNALICEEKIEAGLKTSVKEGYMNISGLENQVIKVIDSKSPQYISKLVLDSVVRNIEKSITYVCQKHNINEIVFAGGVSASEYISKELTLRLRKKSINAYFTKPQFSTDNGVGCAIIGLERFLKSN